MYDRPVTIREVADDAKVGTATVSRVLNEPWRVGPATTARVKASVEKLGYKPNFRARLLARGNSGTVCFLLSNRPFMHSFHARILQGASREADRLGVQIVYTSCHYDRDCAPPEIEMPQILAAAGLIDGVILAGTNYQNMLHAIDELRLPYVVFGTNLVTGDGKRLPNAVYVEEVEGGQEATEHLVGLGHREIRFIGDTSWPWFNHRYLGFCRAMREAGLDCPAPTGSMERESIQMGIDAAEEMIESGAQFTALVCGNDRVAYGAMRTLLRRGIRVPEDVSVVGFDDDEIATLAEPPLTTVRVSTEDIGARCVVMLNDMVRADAKPAEPSVLPVELVPRESTTSR